VNLLWSRYGQRRFQEFLATLAAGTPTEEALQKHFRKRYADLDADLVRALR
jgi:hypothetical protein